MDENEGQCSHPSESRFFAPDEEGTETMLCAACGITARLIHSCAEHLAIAIDPPSEVITEMRSVLGATVSMVIFYGDQSHECDHSGSVTLEQAADACLID